MRPRRTGGTRRHLRLCLPDRAGVEVGGVEGVVEAVLGGGPHHQLAGFVPEEGGGGSPVAVEHLVGQGYLPVVDDLQGFGVEADDAVAVGDVVVA